MVESKTKDKGKQRIIIFSATKSINSLREVFVARYPNGKISPEPAPVPMD